MTALEGPVLAFAPHPDDLAFSIGAALLAAPERRQLVVATIFTRGTWAPLAPVGWGVDEIATARWEEDEQWCAAVGATRLACAFPDASLRGFDDDTELIAAIDPGTAGAVDAAVAGLLAAHPAATLLCPAALGGHVDHRIVKDAVVRHGAERVTWLYEDLPYALGMSQAVIGRALAARGRLRPVVLPLAVPLEAKVNAARAYWTQFREEDAAALRAHALDVGGGSPAERLWRRP